MQAMSTSPGARWKRTLVHALMFRTGRAPRESASIEPLRDACRRLVADLPAVQRDALQRCIDQTRNADDVWHLRSHLFGVLSLTFGEHAARERLKSLDTLWR